MNLKLVNGVWDLEIIIRCCVCYRDLKVVILGSASIGKTTLVHRYLEKHFQESISVSRWVKIVYLGELVNCTWSHEYFCYLRYLRWIFNYLKPKFLKTYRFFQSEFLLQLKLVILEHFKKFPHFIISYEFTFLRWYFV